MKASKHSPNFADAFTRMQTFTNIITHIFIFSSNILSCGLQWHGGREHGNNLVAAPLLNVSLFVENVLPKKFKTKNPIY